MTLKSEVAELRYEVAELSSGKLRLTFTSACEVFLVQVSCTHFSTALFYHRYCPARDMNRAT